MPFAGYRCSVCGAEYGPEGQRYLCPKDGGCLDVVLDLLRARRELGAAGLLLGRGGGRCLLYTSPSPRDS